jgi:2-oxoglutarate dehydrogenase E2 component (dihydrolipoamide succinyltransferase)
MIEIKVPELAESVTEGTIAEWLVKEGDFVEKGSAILELETDKINLEVNSEYSGVIKEFVKAAGDSVEVGEVIAVLDGNASKGASTPPAEKEEAKSETQQERESEKEEAKPKDNATDKKESPAATEQGNKPIASPAARKKARELGVNLNEVTAKDPTGRIRPEDLEKTNKPAPQAGSDQKQPTVKKDIDEKPVERIKMSRRRQTIAKRLVEAQQTAAMLTTFNEVDMTAVMDVRKRRKDAFFEKHGVKLGFMSFFTKAVIGALKVIPKVNAEIQGDEILLKKYYDIGVAVSTDEGLVVPVVRDADKLSFAGIEQQIEELAKKAKTNKLGLNELQGGTFTITNGGIFGSLYSTPILNTPQVGILGMHTIQRRPVVVDNEDTVEVRPMMYIALSYDHRVIDGKEAVQFLVKLKELLEDPEDLLLEG